MLRKSSLWTLLLFSVQARRQSVVRSSVIRRQMDSILSKGQQGVFRNQECKEDSGKIEMWSTHEASWEAWRRAGQGETAGKEKMGTGWRENSLAHRAAFPEVVPSKASYTGLHSKCYIKYGSGETQCQWISLLSDPLEHLMVYPCAPCIYRKRVCDMSVWHLPNLAGHKTDHTLGNYVLALIVDFQFFEWMSGSM